MSSPKGRTSSHAIPVSWAPLRTTHTAICARQLHQICRQRSALLPAPVKRCPRQRQTASFSALTFRPHPRTQNWHSQPRRNPQSV